MHWRFVLDAGHSAVEAGDLYKRGTTTAPDFVRAEAPGKRNI